MENVKTISDLGITTEVLPNQEIEINNSGISQKATIGQITNYLSSNFANTSFSNVDNNLDYVVEKGGNEHKWYRKYKSGFIEQGGDFTTGIIVSTDIRQINFLIPFTTNLYQYSFGTSYINQAVHDATICLNGDMENFKTVSSFIAQRRIAGSTYAFADSDTWFCCGY